MYLLPFHLYYVVSFTADCIQKTGNLLNIQYSFDAVIKVNIYRDLLINFSEIDQILNGN